MRVDITRPAGNEAANRSSSSSSRLSPNMDNVWREFFGVADAMNRMREGDPRTYDYMRSGGSSDEKNERGRAPANRCLGHR